MPVALLALLLALSDNEGPFGSDSECLVHFSLERAKSLRQCPRSDRLVCRDASGHLWLTRQAKRVHGEVHKCTPNGAGDPDLVAWEEVTYVKSDWGRCRIDDERTIVKCGPREKWKKLDREYN